MPILKKFVPLLQRSGLRGLRVRLVMSDFSARNHAFWQPHTLLRSDVAQGGLEFA
ncbi:MAG TPA: hypothetical protein VFL86_14800 [Burkholderiaceae bacterium]|nr:hypothetical protein [Burkholderiaceae bacterium]